MVSILALSVTYGATSPKGRGLGKEMDFAWTAKGSHFEERLPPAGGRCRAATKGGVWHRVSDDGEGEPPKGFIYACNNNTIPQ